MLLNHIILGLLWVLYGVLHSVLASLTIKKRLQKIMGSRFKYYRLFYTIFAFIFLIALIYFQISIDSFRIFQTSMPVLVTGVVVCLFGLSLMGICIKKYFLSLSGLLSLFQDRPPNKLIINGVHRFVRHPLYLGTFIFIWGLFLLFPYLSLLIANTAITIYTLIGIGLEEEKLIAEFGQDYIHYRQQVPKLLPSFTSKRKA